MAGQLQLSTAKIVKEKEKNKRSNLTSKDPQMTDRPPSPDNLRFQVKCETNGWETVRPWLSPSVFSLLLSLRIHWLWVWADVAVIVLMPSNHNQTSSKTHRSDDAGSIVKHNNTGHIHRRMYSVPPSASVKTDMRLTYFVCLCPPHRLHQEIIRPSF